MESLQLYREFVVVSFLMATSPGPSWLYTISTTLSYGRKSGMLGNLGNSTGILFHGLASTIGLSAILHYSTTAFHSLKFIGAAYLVYLGIATFKKQSFLKPKTNHATPSPLQVYSNGALVNILNPKMGILFIVLLPQFVDSSSNPIFQIATMGITHAVVAGCVHTVVVLFSSLIQQKLSASTKLQKSMNIIFGTLFIIFGIRLALMDKV